MLTSDLVRARLYKNEVKPRYVDPEDEETLALAGNLLESFEMFLGRARGELEAWLEELRGSDTDFLLHRGLAKLLFDRASLETTSPMPPEQLRAAVFGAAAARYGSTEAPIFTFERADVLARVAAELETTVEQVESGLFADLRDEQVLTAIETLTPAALLHRYNTALAQGVLIKATSLKIEWHKASTEQARALFRSLKFFQLLHRIEKIDSASYRIAIDGPLSVFQASGRYGVAMASFLPTLLHFSDWSLEAEVRWRAGFPPSVFRLTALQGLAPLGRLVGQWRPEELSWLPDQIAGLDPDWAIDEAFELIDLGGRGVLVPDYVFEHRPSNTRVVIEVFGFWRKSALESRLTELRRLGPKNLILAVSSALAAGRDDLEGLPAMVYVFRSQPLARQVLPLLRQFL